MIELLLALLLGQQPAAPPASPALDYEFYKARVQPLFLEKRTEHARCVTCHFGIGQIEHRGRLIPSERLGLKPQNRFGPIYRPR